MQIKSIKDLDKRILENKLGNVVLIHGNDKEKVKQSENKIKSIVNVMPEFNTIEIEGNKITLDKLKNACETMPLIDEKKVVHIKTPNFVLDNMDVQSKNLLKEVLEYIVDIPDYTILLISHSDIIDKTNTIIKSVDNIGTLVEYKIPTYGNDLNLFIQDKLKENGKSINKSELIYLTSEVINSLENIDKEVEKLSDYMGDRNLVSKKDIDAIIHKTTESNIFKMSDYIFKKDARGALEILDTLLFQGEQYPKIVFMIIRQFRLFYSLKLMLNERVPKDEIRKELKIQEFALKGMMRFIDNWSISEIKSSLDEIIDVDFKIKTGKIKPDLALELLILKMCK